MRVFNLLYLLLLLVALLTSVSSARPGGDTTDTTTAHTDAACLSTPEYPFPKMTPGSQEKSHEKGVVNAVLPVELRTPQHKEITTGRKHQWLK
ncbi:hypothetical protein JOQ06_013765 [Pogonophryne albipinna]|uniref:Secreted protein n=1 Tax=Pogonophryne albipinna TaxID=1090488 RepID=A0AAD6FTF6_9TELE|nr:hypothetical protein JOQ06_013765 [Pogonophryne albipinna]